MRIYAVIIALGCFAYAQCHVFDFEVRTPEWDNAERAVQEKHDREFHEHAQSDRGTQEERDRDNFNTLERGA
jgi:hypothetical protein